MVRTIPYYCNHSWSPCAQATPFYSQSSASNGNVEVTVKPNATNADKPDHVHPDDSPERARHPSLSLRANIHFATLCWTTILAGWNDASNGPLLPRIQQVRVTCPETERLGRVCRGVVNIRLYDLGVHCWVNLQHVPDGEDQLWKNSRDRIGIPGCRVLHRSGGSPLPRLRVCAHYQRLWNGVRGCPKRRLHHSLQGQSRILDGSAHGSIRCRCTVVALALVRHPATYFAQGPHWSHHFLICLGIALLNSIYLTTVFRLKHQEECLAEIGITDTEKGTSKQNPVRQILALKDVHLLAAFLLCHIGAEVTLRGWIVTYIIDLRNGGSSSGYISTGFWAGLTIGRVALIKVNNLIGERHAFLVYTLLAIAISHSIPIPRLEFIVWFVPSLIGNAIAVACIGFLLGPMYPVAMNHAGEVLPQWLLTGALEWIAGGGHAGSVYHGSDRAKGGYWGVAARVRSPVPSLRWCGCLVEALTVICCLLCLGS
ncbi:hypothetical protein J3R82DRAFT_6965 [Butyriboletus roseoflavus]|nr:hypothetical protein J3R82DRAFT_6965 [Butyriboletus roseoflavus]